MNNKEILLEANKYIEDNKIDKNTYQVEKAFVDGANMALSKVENLNLADVINSEAEVLDLLNMLLDNNMCCVMGDEFIEDFIKSKT